MQQQPRQEKNINYLGDTVEDATSTTANWIADAEIKSAIAAEAVKESERIMRMCEDTDAILMLASEIFDKSKYQTLEIFLMIYFTLLFVFFLLNMSSCCF